MTLAELPKQLCLCYRISKMGSSEIKYVKKLELSLACEGSLFLLLFVLITPLCLTMAAESRSRFPHHPSESRNDWLFLEMKFIVDTL